MSPNLLRIKLFKFETLLNNEIMSQLGLQSEARSLSKKEIRDFYTIEIYFELKRLTTKRINLNKTEFEKVIEILNFKEIN